MLCGRGDIGAVRVVCAQMVGGMGCRTTRSSCSWGIKKRLKSLPSLLVAQKHTYIGPAQYEYFIPPDDNMHALAKCFKHLA